MANQQPITPGKKTSEFALVAIVAITGMLVASGIIAPGDAETVTNQVREVVGGIAALVAVVSYVRERTRLKLGG